jgi:prepilin-type N-terminal cleavage/methylation domain-containing protein
MVAKLKDNKGFTLVELLMVMIILGILTQVGMTYFQALRDRSYDAVAIADGKNLMVATGNAFVLLEDVDFTHTPADGPEVGTQRWSGGARAPIFTMSPGVKAVIVGQSETSPGNSFVTAYLYHKDGTDDPGASFTGSGKREFYFAIDEFSSSLSVPELK